MVRRLAAAELVVASHNPGKVREFAALLAPFAVQARSAVELGLAEPEEPGAGFAANAEIKARAAAAAAAMPALADDSGLAVHALGGAPGIHSARWAGPGGDFAPAMRRLEDGLAGKADRGAHFACALCLAWPDGHVVTVEGRVEGCMVWPPRGNQGFGYDPVFVATGQHRTFAEMEPAEKQRLSHRAVAFARLAQACLGA
jgi:XTP/dITP diphosphohydrolase